MKKIWIPLLTLILCLTFISCKKKEKEVTINYEANNGTLVASDNVLPSDFSSFSLPVLTKDGYNFLGWYSDSSFTTKVDSLSNDLIQDGKINLYAKWEEIPVEEGKIIQITDTGNFQFTNDGKISNYQYTFNLSFNDIDLDNIKKFKLSGSLYLKDALDYDFDIFIENGKLYLRGPVEIFTLIGGLKDSILGTMTGYVKVSIDFSKLVNLLKSNYNIDLLKLIKSLTNFVDTSYEDLLNKLKADFKDFNNGSTIINIDEEDIDTLFSILSTITNDFNYEKKDNGFKLSISNEGFLEAFSKCFNIIKLLTPAILNIYDYINATFFKENYAEVKIDDYIIPNNLPYFFDKDHNILYYNEEYLDLGEIVNNVFIPNNNDSYVFIINKNYNPFNYCDTEIIEEDVYFLSSDGYNVLSSNGEIINIKDFIPSIGIDKVNVNNKLYYVYKDFVYDEDFVIVNKEEANKILTEIVFSNANLDIIKNNLKLNELSIEHESSDESELNKIDLSLEYDIYKFALDNDFQYEYIDKFTSTFNTRNVLDITNIIVKYLTNNN